MKITETLGAKGINFAELINNTRSDIQACIVSDRRLLVSAMSPYTKPITSRLDVSHNLSLDDATSDDKPISIEPMLPAIRQARSALLHSLAQAHLFCENGLDDISRCIRMSIAVCTSPNFASLGALQYELRHFAKGIFEQDHLPSASTYGVAVLPGQVLLTVEAEYELKS